MQQDHLTDIKANSKFRNEASGLDLKDTVTKAKKEHGIKYFMVWHAIAGYVPSSTRVGMVWCALRSTSDTLRMLVFQHCRSQNPQQYVSKV